MVAWSFHSGGSACCDHALLGFMRTQWTDELIALHLSDVIAEIGRMPTVSELRTRGRTDLEGQISRKGGYIHWAEKLGTVRKPSDSDKGWDGEKQLAELLTAQGFKVVRQSAVKSPFDLLLDGVLKIDVKAASYRQYGACRGWFYRIGKSPQADIVALLQTDTGDCYFIPWQRIPSSNVTVSRDGGKYAAFRNRYDLIRTLVDRRKQEVTEWP